MQFADIKNDIAFRKIFGNEQKTAFLEADKYLWDKEDLKAYDNVGIKAQDERGEKELAARKAEEKGREKGRKEGRKEGREEGKEEKEAETVIKLHLKGKSDEEIADLLDIPVERVKEMIKQYYDNNK